MVRWRAAHRDESNDDEPLLVEDTLEGCVTPWPRGGREEHVNVGENGGEGDEGDEGVNDEEDAALGAAVLGAEDGVENDDADEERKEAAACAALEKGVRRAYPGCA